MTDARLERWLDALLTTPGLTAIGDREQARARLLEDAVRALPAVSRFDGPIVDVGSGAGTPGIPLAAALPDREVTLLEATGWKCDFLRSVTRTLPNVRVVHGRAEEQPTDAWGVAVAKALAPPPVAAEWCLPLVRPGGAAVVWVGASADVGAVARVAEQLAAAPPAAEDGLLVVRKLGPTPPGFPRRVGVARKRPLA